MEYEKGFPVKKDETIKYKDTNIPSSYQAAEWRCTIPPDKNTGRMGVGFNLNDGTVIRLSISTECARSLSQTITDYLTRGQSLMSPGIPSLDVSYPPGGVKV